MAAPNVVLTNERRFDDDDDNGEGDVQHIATSYYINNEGYDKTDNFLEAAYNLFVEKQREKIDADRVHFAHRVG